MTPAEIIKEHFASMENRAKKLRAAGFMSAQKDTAGDIIGWSIVGTTIVGMILGSGSAAGWGWCDKIQSTLSNIFALFGLVLIIFSYVLICTTPKRNMRNNPKNKKLIRQKEEKGHDPR